MDAPVQRYDEFRGDVLHQGGGLREVDQGRVEAEEPGPGLPLADAAPVQAVFRRGQFVDPALVLHGLFDGASQPDRRFECAGGLVIAQQVSLIVRSVDTMDKQVSVPFTDGGIISEGDGFGFPDEAARGDVPFLKAQCRGAGRGKMSGVHHIEMLPYLERRPPGGPETVHLDRPHPVCGVLRFGEPRSSPREGTGHKDCTSQYKKKKRAIPKHFVFPIR